MALSQKELARLNWNKYGAVQGVALVDGQGNPVELTTVTGPAGPAGPPGSIGPAGPAGPTGSTGAGVPVGGTTGQVLSKIDATNYNTQWTAASAGTGDVVGPSSAVANNVALFNGTTGKLIKDSGLALTGTNTGDQLLFSTIAVSGQSNVVADTTSDTLTLAAGSNVTITTNAGTDTVTIASTAGGSGTVTATGGSLTANAVVLGAGSTDTKVVPGIFTDGVNLLTLGTTGSDLGSVRLSHSASSTYSTLRAATASSASTAYEFPSTGGGGTETVATRSWVSGPGITNGVTGTGFWHSTGASLDGAAIGETGSGNVARATSPTFVTPLLGTPTSGTLTNCTGLPVAGITASTSTALGVGSIELGHASDTTIARSGAGAITVEGAQVVLSGAALGTPASGTLTNCTGLPVAGITASTSTALGVGSIELGNASDTTISRVSAGVISVEGVTVPTAATAAQTMAQTSTSKAVTPDDVAYAIFGMAWRYPSCYSSVDFSTANQAGTGGNTVNSNGFSITSGATANSWAFKNTAGSLSGLSPSTTGSANGLNFDKRMGFKITLRHDAGTTNGVSRFTLVNSTSVGANGSGTTAKLAGKGIGIEIRNSALWAAVHDGTTYSSTSLSTTLTQFAYTTVGAFRSGSGTFDFYVNGAFILTQSGGPTGTTTSHTITAYWAADNNADAAAQTSLLVEVTVFQAIG